MTFVRDYVPGACPRHRLHNLLLTSVLLFFFASLRRAGRPRFHILCLKLHRKPFALYSTERILQALYSSPRALSRGFTSELKLSQKGINSRWLLITLWWLLLWKRINSQWLLITPQRLLYRPILSRPPPELKLQSHAGPHPEFRLDGHAGTHPEFRS